MAEKELKTKNTKPKTAVKAVSKVTKSVTKKIEVKTAKPVVKNAEVKAAPVSLKVTVVGVDGSSKGTITLPTDIFGAKPNKTLIAQAVRVYLANQRQGNASTKTRNEVVGSTRKIYRQKGTGRARHGALKAPIFVGGGIAHGPRPHSFTMDFPKKMKKAALISALSDKAQAGSVKVIDGEFTGKTKEMATLITKMDLGSRGKANKVLLVVDNKGMATRAGKNIGGLEIESAMTVSTYGVFVSRNVVILKNAVEELSKRLTKN